MCKVVPKQRPQCEFLLQCSASLRGYAEKGYPTTVHEPSFHRE